MTSNVELLPCPFCGAPAERIDFGPGDAENEGGSCISCTQCQASGPVDFGYKENFISNWSRRARANVSHATTTQAAEIDALRAEVERLTGCLATANANHETFERRWYLEQDRAERLAEALRDLMGWVSTDNYFTDEPMQALARARAALHPTAEQENDDA